MDQAKQGVDKFWNRLMTFKPDNDSVTAFLKTLGVPLTTAQGWKWHEPKLTAVEIAAESLETTPLYLLFGLGPRDRETAEKWFSQYAEGQTRGG
jgi:hypothetical protein